MNNFWEDSAEWELLPVMGSLSCTLSKERVKLMRILSFGILLLLSYVEC